MAQQYPPIEKIRSMGYTVEQFSEYHFRVEHQIDCWYPRGRWHDLVTGERGKVPLDQLHFFVDRRIKSRSPEEMERNNFITNLLSIGWTKQQSEDAWEKRKAKSARSSQHHRDGESTAAGSRRQS